MSATATTLKIVLASPGDVVQERDVADQVIRDLQPIAMKMGITLLVQRWEDVTPGFDPEGVQARIDKALKINECDLLIGMFWKRYGFVDSDGDSRTAKEIREAVAAKQRTGVRPEIMIYFCTRPCTPVSPEDTDQQGRVLHFKQELQEQGLTTDYEAVEDFRSRLSVHLFDFVLESSRKESQKEGSRGHVVCRATGSPTLVRSEGYTELLGEILLTVKVDSVEESSTQIQISVFATTNVTNRVSEDRVTDVLLTRKEGNQLFAPGKMMPNKGLSNAIEFDPIQIGTGIVEEFRIRGIRVDAEFLGPGDPLFATVVVTRLKDGVSTSLLAESVVLGFSVWSVNFSAQTFKDSRPIRQRGYALTVHFSETCPGSFKTHAQESKDGWSVADHGTVLCVATVDIPPEFQVFVTTRDLPAFATGTSLDTLVRAIAVKPNALGTPVGHAEVVEAPTWPGGISMTRIDRSSNALVAAWELVTPLTAWRRSHRALSFGILIVGRVDSPILDKIQLAGGYAPFYSSSAARLPNATLHVPRFVPSYDEVEVLLGPSP